jgi:hypothetical protein
VPRAQTARSAETVADQASNLGIPKAHAMADAHNSRLEGKQWRFYRKIPRALQEAFQVRQTIIRNLQTADLRRAERASCSVTDIGAPWSSRCLPAPAKAGVTAIHRAAGSGLCGCLDAGDKPRHDNGVPALSTTRLRYVATKLTPDIARR